MSHCLWGWDNDRERSDNMREEFEVLAELFGLTVTFCQGMRACMKINDQTITFKRELDGSFRCNKQVNEVPSTLIEENSQFPYLVEV